MSANIDARLPGGFRAAADARERLKDLEDLLPHSLLDDVRLLVNELVTNSVRHARVSSHDEIRLVVSVAPECVRVEVGDAGPGFTPDPPTPSLSQGSGWGLYLVDQLADRWGVESIGGSTVWFEIDR